MWDAVLGVIKKGDGVECPYRATCKYGKSITEYPCPYYWLSKKNVKPS